MNNIKKISVFILMVCLVGLFSGCPKSKADLETYKKRSAQFATATYTAADVTLELYNSKTITLEQKDKIADAFLSLTQSGKIIDAQIEKLLKEHGANVPKDKLELVVAFFKANIIDGLLDAFERLRILNIDPQFRLVITSIKTSVILLAQVFNIKEEAELKLAEVK